jgi:peptidylprolyl isomerase
VAAATSFRATMHASTSGRAASAAPTQPRGTLMVTVPTTCQWRRAVAVRAQQHQEPDHAAAPSRRQVLVAVPATAAAALLLLSAAPTLPAASAAGFRKELKKRKVPLEEYSVSPDNGLRYYDVEVGRGGGGGGGNSGASSGGVSKGDTATVHFDCVYRGIDAVSSRYARTLGGNRTVAEPFTFTAGFPLPTVAERMAASGSGGGGLFAGGTGPQPPPALTTAVLGMRPGGKRTVYVDVPELGYAKGNQEIPAGGAFELKIELLSVAAGSGGGRE